MLLPIGSVQDGRYNTNICCGSDHQIKPLGPHVSDVVLDVVSDIITVGVCLVDIYWFRTERHFIVINKE